MRERLAKLCVVERRFVDSPLKRVPAPNGDGNQLDPGARAQRSDGGRGQFADEVELASDQPLGADHGVRDVPEHHAIEVRFARLPVRRIPLDRDVATAHPFLEHERSGADGIAAELLAEFLSRGGRHHEARTFAEQAKQAGRWLLEIERYGRRIDDLDVIDDRLEQLALWRCSGGVEPVVDIPFDGIRVERRAVVELHSRSKLEDDLLPVVLDLPALREVRLEGEVGAVSYQRVEYQVEHLALAELDRERRVEGLGICAETDGQRAALGWRLCPAAQASQAPVRVRQERRPPAA